MRMIGLFLGVLTVTPVGTVAAQSASAESAVMDVVYRLFDAMRAGDSASARSLFEPDARLLGIASRDGVKQIRALPIDRFVQAIGSPHEQVWDEQIWDWEVRIDDDLATVWTKYAFYLGETFSHCGVDAFQLLRSADGWKIVSLADTRRQESCEMPPSQR